MPKSSSFKLVSFWIPGLRFTSPGMTIEPLRKDTAMTPSQLITLIKTNPKAIVFKDVIATIDAHYSYTPTRFTNGSGETQAINEDGSNEGSCKIFAFAQLNNLNKEETLACFGHYYRDDVLKHPGGSDHTNIRNFMQFGWDGIRFEESALK